LAREERYTSETVAKGMKGEKIDIKIISKLTGLPEELIKKL